MKADLKRFWGILSGKQEKPRPRLRSTSLPRITSCGLIGFSYEYVPQKDRKCAPLWYDYDLGKKSNTFPRRTKQKNRSNLPGRDRSSSVSVDVGGNNEGLSRKYPRRGSTTTTRYFKVDIDETINEEETLDMKDLKNELTSVEADSPKIEKTMTTVLCSTDL